MGRHKKIIIDESNTTSVVDVSGLEEITNETEQLKEKLREPVKIILPNDNDYLSTGSRMLDLACSDRNKGGLLKGYYYLLAGMSAAGKTWQALNILAEAAKNPNFDDYLFVYDGNEFGALMDICKYFGTKVAKRIQPPRLHEDGSPRFSSTVEEFYFTLDDYLEKGKPIIYIEDSMDSLSSEEEGTKFDEQKKAFQKGKEASGSYAMGKAKWNATALRQMLDKINKTKSILIIVSQLHDNVGTFSFEKHSRSGGHALKYYATVEIWCSIKDTLKKTVMGKPRQVGINCQMKIKKNRLTGRLNTVTVPIYNSYGIDDLGGQIDYLIEEGHWNDKGPIDAPEFEFKGSKEKLIEFIEEKGLEEQLASLTYNVWETIRQQCELRRKKRYE